MSDFTISAQCVALLEGQISYHKWEAHLPQEKRCVRLLGTAEGLLDAGMSLARSLLRWKTEA